MVEGGDRGRATGLGLSVDHGGQGLYSLQGPQIQESTWEEGGQRHGAKLVGTYTCSNPALALRQVNQGCSQPLLPPAGCPEEAGVGPGKGGRRLQRRGPALPLGHAQEIRRKGPGASSLAWSFSEGAAATARPSLPPPLGPHRGGNWQITPGPEVLRKIPHCPPTPSHLRLRVRVSQGRLSQG